MQLYSHPEFDDHRQVVFVREPHSGLSSIIAIHRYGERFAAGGIRMYPYDDETLALTDVLRLSRAMTYKMAVAGLPAGGAKSVIIGDPARDKTRALLEAFAHAVNSLGGAYHCGGDVGIYADDMAVIREFTGYTPPATVGDLSVPTSQGVFQGIRAGVKHALGRDDLEGVTVAVQGVGQVGAKLCRLLRAAGCVLVVSDVDDRACREIAEETGATVVDPADILAQPVDVLSPCALGAVLGVDTLPQIKANIVCGAANNQLADSQAGVELRRRGITFVPDFVANAGGAIGGLQTSFDYDADECDRRVAAIYDSALAILDMAREKSMPADAAAEEYARQLMATG